MLTSLKGFLEKNTLITAETLCEAMRSFKCMSYLQIILIVLVFLRNENIKVRLCISFDAYELNDESKKTKNLMKSEQNKPKTSAPVKRKSDTVKIESKETASKKAKSSKAPKINKKTRISGKLSKLSDEDFSESDVSFEEVDGISSSDSESPKKRSKKKVNKKTLVCFLTFIAQ